MRTASGLPRKPCIEPPSFKIDDRVYFKTNSQENGISSGHLDIGLFVFSTMDITYTLKIRLLGKQGHAMSRT